MNTNYNKNLAQNNLTNAHKISITPVQIPNKDNGNLAIVQYFVQISDSICTSFVATNSITANSDDLAVILEHATAKAREQAYETIAKIQNKSNSQMTTHQVALNFVPQALSSQEKEDKSKLNGGGNKPASEKQISLIYKLCQDKQLNIKMMNTKPLNMLTGEEANDMIKEIK